MERMLCIQTQLSPKSWSVSHGMLATVPPWSASNLCKAAGGYLPIIRSREELHEIISFIKLSELYMPQFEIMFLGLKESESCTVKFLLNLLSSGQTCIF